MNRTWILPSGLLLLAIVLAVVKVTSRDEPVADEGERAGERSAARTSEVAAVVPESRARERQAQRDAELAETYGSVRTKLARKISADAAMLLEQGIGMGEQMIGLSQGAALRRLDQRLRRRGIDLDESQREQVAALVSSHLEGRLGEFRAGVQTLRQDPTALMELLLAGDAKERGTMSESDYSAVRAATAEQLASVINPLDRNNFRPGQPLRDPQFLQQLEAVLDADQRAALAASEAERESRRAERGPDAAADPGGIASLPTMRLETLDEAIGSATQIAAGAQQMIQGLGSLRTLQPELENRSEGE